MARGRKRKAAVEKEDTKNEVEEAKQEEEQVEEDEKQKEEAVEEEKQEEEAVEEEKQEDEDQEEQNKQKKAKGKKKAAPPKKVGRKPKRARIAKPEVEPEYFKDKRNLEDLWKEVFPVGTEWDQLDSVYQFNWNFKNLEDAFEEDGVLHGKRVYLFGSTEPQMVPFKNENKIICIPVVVAVVSPFPPSDKIGINSVQREKEEIVPMKSMKMDWVPYIPLENRESMVERLKSEIFILRCNQRRSALKHLKEDRLKKFEYCLPYFYNPLQEEEIDQSTVVDFLYSIEPNPPVVVEFDWELDELEEYTDQLIEAEELEADEKEKFKEALREKVREQKKENREAREARKKAREALNEEKKAAYENMKIYKFYPVASPDSPDVSNVKASFVNRYYGKAHEVL